MRIQVGIPREGKRGRERLIDLVIEGGPVKLTKAHKITIKRRRIDDWFSIYLWVSSI